MVGPNKVNRCPEVGQGHEATCCCHPDPEGWKPSVRAPWSYWFQIQSTSTPFIWRSGGGPRPATSVLPSAARHYLAAAAAPKKEELAVS